VELYLYSHIHLHIVDRGNFTKAQYVPYISLPFPWKFSDIFVEPFCSGVRRLSRTDACAVALPLAKLGTQSNTVLHGGSVSPQFDRYPTLNI
jgi:hypothetical protein